MEMRKFIVEIQKDGTVKAVEYCDEKLTVMTRQEWNKYLIRAGMGLVVRLSTGEPHSDEYVRGYKEALSRFIDFLGNNYRTSFK